MTAPITKQCSFLKSSAVTCGRLFLHARGVAKNACNYSYILRKVGFMKQEQAAAYLRGHYPKREKNFAIY